MNINMNFLPTYLYIKQHSITGKCYFGKTTKKDPIKYLGSGKYWTPHIGKYGKEHVETIWYCLFIEQEECNKFALLFSEQEDIVNSNDWANLVPENGLYDNYFKGSKHSDESKAKMKAAKQGKKRGPRSKEVKMKISDTKRAQNKSCPDEVRLKISIAKTGKKTKPQSIIQCPYCLKEGHLANMKRFHFDNCKIKNGDNNV